MENELVEQKRGMGTGSGTGAEAKAGAGEEKKKKKQKPEDSDGKEQYRVVIDEEANMQLEMALKKVMDGAEHVYLTKSDLANYLICNLGRSFGESEIKAIRSLHFDETKVLKGLLKRVKNESELPPDLKRALREAYGFSEKDKKRAAKGVQTPLSDDEKTAA